MSISEEKRTRPAFIVKLVPSLGKTEVEITLVDGQRVITDALTAKQLGCALIHAAVSILSE